MAASSGNDEDGMVSGINVTPFVDICLVLLIIFMVTARFIDQKGMNMDLPKSAQGTDTQQIFGVELHLNGTTTVNGKPVTTDDAILAAAKEAQAKNPDLRATVKADSAVPHGRFVRAVELLKTAGIGKIAIGVSPGESTSPAAGAAVAPIGSAP
ncbi:MAG TPA: biopolymer transporter ExbD [Byssovorax sp.]|jgi:biopolymer transport protein ExbD